MALSLWPIFRYIDSLTLRKNPKRPSLFIETTNSCNSDCVFCPNSKMARPIQQLQMGQFENAVKQFVRMGGQKLDLTTVIGEPLLDDQILLRVRYTKRFPQLQNVGFISTLQHLRRFSTEDLLHSGIDWITVSSVLWGPEHYSKFFGVNLYHHVLRNIETLLKENARLNYPVIVYFSLKPTGAPLELILNHPDFKRIESLYGDGLTKAAHKLCNRVDDWGGNVRLPDYLKARPLLPRAFAPCARLNEGLRVFSNGKVGACSCRDFEASSELILGDINSGLHSLWNGKKHHDLYQRWRTMNRIPGVCRTCRDYRGADLNY